MLEGAVGLVGHEPWLTWLCLAISPMCREADGCENKITCATKDLTLLFWKLP